MPEFKYHVAISFLARDIDIARALYAALAPRLKVFMYERSQEEVAGTDGLETFRSPFRSESALNVILFREGYEQTPWTRVEAAAIKDRALEGGWETVLLASLVAGEKPPKWLPQSRIYASVADFGVDGLAAVVLARTREIGVQERIETPAELAERLLRTHQDEERRASIESSDAGVRMLKSELIVMFEHVERSVALIAQNAPGERVVSGADGEHVVVQIRDHALSIGFRLNWSNTLEKSGLHARIIRGYMRFPGARGYDSHQVTRLVDRDFRSRLAKGDRWVWHEDGRGRPFSSTELADELVAALVRAAFPLDGT